MHRHTALLALSFTSLCTLASIASADSTLPPIDAASIPAECASVATAPADATIAAPAIEARISLAVCAAMSKVGAMTLAPDAATASAINTAVAPSFKWLDEAISANDATWGPIASRTRSNLLVALAVRMRLSVPAITPTTLGDALTQRQKAHETVEALIKPWLDQVK